MSTAFVRGWRSVMSEIDWRRYGIVLLLCVPLTFVLVVLDATVGIALEWTWWPLGLAYGIAGLRWSLKCPAPVQADADDATATPSGGSRPVTQKHATESREGED